MIVFFLLLLVALGLVGVYAYNNTGTHDVTFLQWHWSGVPDWMPVVVAAAVIGGLFLLYMILSGLVSGVRQGSLRKRVSSYEGTVADLRRENQRLREENARLRSDMRGTDRGVAATGDRERMAVADREVTPVGRDNAPVYEDTTTDRTSNNAVPADRSRTTSAYRARPSFGARVRSFFGGREPAGY